jgi:hypothetical protein
MNMQATEMASLEAQNVASDASAMIGIMEAPDADALGEVVQSSVKANAAAVGKQSSVTGGVQVPDPGAGGNCSASPKPPGSESLEKMETFGSTSQKMLGQERCLIQRSLEAPAKPMQSKTNARQIATPGAITGPLALSGSTSMPSLPADNTTWNVGGTKLTNPGNSLGATLKPRGLVTGSGPTQAEPYIVHVWEEHHVGQKDSIQSDLMRLGAVTPTTGVRQQKRPASQPTGRQNPK